ncbi:Werner Syndrome-like exonuclease isoform X1 [Neodiprion fabricii]|uniref:Werner Syndrome-like exonuclease isoform X1 n=2 Tax=Neodiprion fabricii TaxID=2872261 RepID=UPI001ED96865|nr:Werner Syndrome-like exonuclease isoform X1 [Neodiprion fabricii]
MEYRGATAKIPSENILTKSTLIKNNEIQPRRSPRIMGAAAKENNKTEVVKPVLELSEILFEGKINYADTFGDCAMACDEVLQLVQKKTDIIVPIGFDLEWPFSFQTGSGKTALIQICMDYKICHLLHVYELRKLPAALIELLIHPKVRLVGVNIKNDVWKLGRDFKEFPSQKVVENNCIDCGTFANATLNRSCRWSMANLTAYVLQKEISKDPKVRRSKWHIQPLSDAQKSYAATDAYVSLLLYNTLQDKANENAS